MIATLRGEVSQIEENALIVEVGGVGLRVLVPAPLRTNAKRVKCCSCSPISSSVKMR
jgi:Holliday junction resolvasome RuvABC DNA-binding subunit